MTEQSKAVETLQPVPQRPALPEIRSMNDFFESTPPGKLVDFLDCLTRETTNGRTLVSILLPSIQLPCRNTLCGGIRSFDTDDEIYMREGLKKNSFIVYQCRNCKITTKTYAMSSWIRGTHHAVLLKFGEEPQFGPSVSKEISALIGKDRDYFFKGQRSEGQALGIAAFAYYRRVIESRKDEIFDEIIKVCKKLDANPEVIADFEKAKTETQFSAAVEQIKHGIPDSLRIDGHNPITLLHSALSEGIHALSDEECLARATSIRVVLTELVERMALALKNEAELSSAVSKLLALKGAKANDKS